MVAMPAEIPAARLHRREGHPAVHRHARSLGANPLILVPQEIPNIER